MPRFSRDAAEFAADELAIVLRGLARDRGAFHRRAGRWRPRTAAELEALLATLRRKLRPTEIVVLDLRLRGHSRASISCIAGVVPYRVRFVLEKACRSLRPGERP